MVKALGFDGRRNERRLLSRLGTIRKRAGRVRDMDVLTGHTATVAVDGEQDCLLELLEYLGAECYRHARRLRQLMRQDGAALRKRLKRTSKRIDERVPAPGAHSSDTDPLVAKEAIATALKLSGELATPATLSRRTLHPYRLKVKDLRNVLKMATDADRRGFVTRLGEIKDAIGEWHDWETLIAIARDQLPHGARCGFAARAQSHRRSQVRGSALADEQDEEGLPPPPPVGRATNPGDVRRCISQGTARADPCEWILDRLPFLSIRAPDPAPC
jgi:CHAD domain-containing protein